MFKTQHDMDFEGLQSNMKVNKIKSEEKRQYKSTDLIISKVDHIEPIIFSHDQDMKNLKDLKLSRILSNNRKSRVFNTDRKITSNAEKDFQININF